jgi:Icc protein
MVPKPIRIIQISDMHVLADDGALLGVNTTDSFNAVIQAIQTETTAPNLLLLTGDMSQD